MGGYKERCDVCVIDVLMSVWEVRDRRGVRVEVVVRRDGEEVVLD